ncbi:MAG TPA: YihY/virulence factor BrkB family protein [Chryseosolibacter sp.]|nr:YihY/virulence factor BrkB family protein [Chryseosolibacter sp.]
MKLGQRAKDFWMLLKKTFKVYIEREPFNNAIIIAYYTIFSLPGLLVIIINLAGYFFGQEAVTNQISTQLGGIIGGDTAKTIQEMVAKASTSDGTVLATVLSVATLIFGATGVFYQLQQILNKMWEVAPKPKQKILKLVKDRVFSFGLILVIGFLLLVSLVLSAAVTAVSDWFSHRISDGMSFLFKAIDIIVSLGIITTLFAAIYKFLPDAKIRWKDVWIGAVMTSVLFVIAKFALGVYFAKSDPGSTYGAAGTIILILLWVTYAGMILLFGAEFTKVYADTYGVDIQPTKGAMSTHGKDDNGAIVNKKTGEETRKRAGGPGGSDNRQRDRSKEKKKISERPRASGGSDTFHYEPPAS